MKSMITAGMAIAALAATSDAATLYGIATDNNIYRFDSATPGAAVLVGANSQGLADFDVHAANGLLYGVTGSGALYHVNLDTGSGSQVFGPNATFTSTLTSIDFNPAADRIRLAGVGNSNIRLVPDFASLPQTLTPPGAGTAINDGTFAFDNGRVTTALGVAYTNPIDNPGVLGTLLFSMTADGFLNSHASTAPQFNNGVAVGTGLGFTPVGSGFDIDVNNLGYAFGTGVNGTGLYSVNLGTGAGTFLGEIGTGTSTLSLTGLAVIPEPSHAVIGLLGGLFALRRRRN